MTYTQLSTSSTDAHPSIFSELRVYFLVLATLMLVFGAVPARAEVKTVPYVDIEKYLGDWYEIGSIPQRFSKDCFCTRAQYSLQPDGKISVYNTCNNGSVTGSLREADGTATVADKNTNSKLDVSFFWPFKGDYWIIGLDADYRYAVISNEAGTSLWILSRKPTLSQADTKKALDIATANGIDISKLNYTEQRACVYP